MKNFKVRWIEHICGDEKRLFLHPNPWITGSVQHISVVDIYPGHWPLWYEMIHSLHSDYLHMNEQCWWICPLGDIFRFIVDYRKHPQHRRRWNGTQNQEDINFFSTRLNYSFQWNKSLYDKYILGNFENTKTVWKYNCCTIGKVRFIYEALHWAIIWSPGNLKFFFTGIPQGPLETSWHH